MTGKKRTEGGRRFRGFDFFPPTIFLFLVIALFLVVAMPAPGGIGRTLSVRNFSPEGLVDGPVAIRVIFSSDVVRSSDVGIDLSPERSPLFFSPALPGTGRWENPATFIYRPSSGFLSAATAYTVVVDEKLSDLPSSMYFCRRNMFCSKKRRSIPSNALTVLWVVVALMTNESPRRIPTMARKIFFCNFMTRFLVPCRPPDDANALARSRPGRPKTNRTCPSTQFQWAKRPTAYFSITSNGEKYADLIFLK